MPSSLFNALDVHEFARLLELPDDEMANHVTVKLNSNASTKLFDLCESYDKMKSRVLLLFNSTRIILSIGNFSMPHVMVVVTAGRPLAPDQTQCPDHLVECQVLGTRLCIDSTNACDGIPNCGSSNAYDEDHVLCGLIGRKRNVYLAAATFLALLATTVYIIHYWLKRCVPNVADAFFVYSDGAENELYLDSIMRSPTDDGNGTNYLYNSSFFEEENISSYYDRGKSASIFRRVFSILPKLRLFRQQRLSSEVLEEQVVKRALSEELPKKIYSFPELEIRNMINAVKVDREIQTGESLEIAYLKKINSLNKDLSEIKPESTRQRESSVDAIILRRLQSGHGPGSFDTSSDLPGPSGGIDVPGVVEEKEIHSTFYEPDRSKILMHKTTKTSSTSEATHNRKHLRFNEQATWIPRGDVDDDDNSEINDTSARTRRHSVVYMGRTGRRLHQKADDNNSERAHSDFRKFFKKKKDYK